MSTSRIGGRSAPEPAPPRRARLSIIIPALVALATGALLAWSAWPALSPTRVVTVTQAVFVRGEEAATIDVARQSADEPEPDSGPARSSRFASRSGETVQAAGWLEAEPYWVAATALADGVIETVEVLEGDQVEKGQVVATLVAEDAELRAAKAEASLEIARANLALAEAELTAAQEAWEEFVDRTRAVEVGRAALAEAEAELVQLPALIGGARADLARLQEELTGAERSLARGAATELETVIAREQVNAQRARVEALEARRAILEARIEMRRADVRAAERHLDLRIEERRNLNVAKANVRRAQAAVIQAEAARDEAALEFSRMTIESPISGYVQRRLKVPGDKVILGMDDPYSSHVVHLYDPSSLRVRVDVPLADAAHVFIGQTCEVVVEALPETPFEGEVLRVTHEADLQKNTLEVQVGVKDPSPILKPEMLTRVKFLPKGETAGRPASSSQSESGGARTLVRLEALERRPGSARVWAVRERRGDRGVARPLEVQMLSEKEGWAVVSGSLRAGELVVMNPEGLKPGERVQMRGADEAERGATS